MHMQPPLYPSLTSPMPFAAATEKLVLSACSWKGENGREQIVSAAPLLLRRIPQLIGAVVAVGVVLMYFANTEASFQTRLRRLAGVTGDVSTALGQPSPSHSQEPDAVSQLRLYRRTAAANAAAEKLRKRSASAARLLQPTTSRCEDESRWDQMQWDYLSQPERNAWMMLGWMPDDWDAAHPIPTTTFDPLLGAPRRLDAELSPEEVTEWDRRLTEAEYTTTIPLVGPRGTLTWRPFPDYSCYQHLKPDQQDAVKILNYDIESWHACKNPTCPWPSDIPKPDASCRDELLYLEEQYTATPTNKWVDLSAGTRNALMELGYDERGVRFTTLDKPPVYSRKWSELMPREAEAADFLGYTKRSWQLCFPETPCLIRLQALETKMSNLRTAQTGWKNMPSGIKVRLEELGWSERSWSEGELPAPMQLPWLELPYPQRIAATLLTYTEDTWARCPSAPCLDRFDYVRNKFKNVKWAELTEAQKRAWMLLEHSAELWEQGKNPQSMQLQWKELSDEQRRQAEFLGHSQGTWQGCNENWVEPESYSNATEQPLDPNRIVRARMRIQRSFTEISGNVYGTEVADLPTSFIEIFERSVARGLFCKNPPLSATQSTYVDASGQPSCNVRQNYELQRNRIKVVTVVEGSIIVDFYIQCGIGQQYHDGVCQEPQPDGQPTSPELFAQLQKLLENPQSPLSMDSEFGRFALVATVEEVAYSNLEFDMMRQAMEFEQLRGQYDTTNACELGTDYRDGIKGCAQASAPPSLDISGFAFVLVAASLAIAPSRA